MGGTHCDGVAIDRQTAKVVARVKVTTTPDLKECSGQALRQLLETVAPQEIARVVLSTTLVTNAVVTDRLEPVGMLLMAGPGIDPNLLSDDPLCRVVTGAMDHRGKELIPLDPDSIRRQLEAFRLKGVAVVSVAGKFAVRNPAHELKITALARDDFDYVCAAHRLSGSLNFPRRAATAYLCAGVWRLQSNFVDAMAQTVRGMGIDAPLYLLRADGGAQSADHFDNPAEASLSGPAASIMGVLATEQLEEETVSFDIGGTTTDIAIFISGAPLIEPHGATIGKYKTQIRALYNRSIAAGGDSVLTVHEGSIIVGPNRYGPAAAFGGPNPTPTDALIVLGRTEGNKEIASEALSPLAAELGVTVEEFATSAVASLCKLITDAATAFINDINARPVYTIHEMLDDHKVAPQRAVVVGAPGKAISPYLSEALGIKTDVPANYDVANAIGAAVAGLNLEVNAVADTATGTMTIPEAGIQESIDRTFSMEDLEREADAALSTLAARADQLGEEYQTDATESESFRIVEGHSFAGAIHRLRLKVRPSILCRVKE